VTGAKPADQKHRNAEQQVKKQVLQARFPGVGGA
jgi:hypothetical protein